MNNNKHYLIIEVFSPSYDDDALDTRVIMVLSDKEKAKTAFKFIVDRVNEGNYDVAYASKTIKSLFLSEYIDGQIDYETIYNTYTFGIDDTDQYNDK